MTNLQEIEQRLIPLEKQVLQEHHELTEEQKQELRNIRLALPQENTTEINALHDRISRLGDVNSNLINVHFEEHLEEEYERLDKEFRSPTTTPERRAEIIKEQRVISKEIRMRQQ